DTQRAFIMVSVMLVAILLDRPAISLRSLVIAALIILLLRPENLLHPGFQMSFAATSALIAGFEALRNVLHRQKVFLLKEGSALFLSSFLAGAATAPIAAFHFNRIALYGLPANLMTVPLMGLVIVPFLMLGAVFDIIGLGWLFFMPVEWAITWILEVAYRIAAQNGSVLSIGSTPISALVALVVFWSVFLFWKGTLRWIALATCIPPLLFWGSAERPDILVSARSGAVGISVEETRIVNKERAGRFEITQWLENDGSHLDQEDAFARWPAENPAIFDEKILVYSGSKKPTDWLPCSAGTLVIAPKLDVSLRGECQQITAHSFKGASAFQIYLKEKGAEIAPVSGSGRLWQN
ncbi:MAG: ComEC/Rec2 family competence protein, partial [Pseudomonadota bacterium]